MKGYSFIETMISMVIFFIIIGTLLPFSVNLKHTLQEQKLSLHASEVALEAVHLFLGTGKVEGTKTIENVQYVWNFDGDEVCVHYQHVNMEKTKCINKEGEYQY